jgi:hypothetical protein
VLPLSSTMVVLDSVRGYFDRISTAKPEDKEQAMETRGATGVRDESMVHSLHGECAETFGPIAY